MVNSYTVILFIEYFYKRRETMDYHALFLDIDGIILKPDHTYSNITKSVIKQVQQKGIEVFLATGRPIHEIYNLAHELGIDSFIGYNGAYASYQDRVILNETIDRNIIEQYLNISKENKHEIVFYSNDTNYFTSLDHPFVKHFIKTFELTYNEIFTEDVSDSILGITVMNLDENQPRLYELNDNVHLSQVNVAGLGHCYDVIQKKVNKGKAVQEIIQHLKTEKQKTIAFGDGMNDKEMLEAVGEGFAMGNAHPDL